MKLLYIVAKAEYFLSHRLSLAEKAEASGFNIAVATTPFKKGDHRKIIGIKRFPVKFKRGSLNIFAELKVLFSLYKAFKKFKPSLVHNVALKPALYGGGIARILKIPRVSSINGFGYIFTSNQIKAKLLKPIVKLAIKIILGDSSSCIMVQNQQDYDTCKKLLPKSLVCLVSGSGVSIRNFYPVKHDPKRAFTFALVSRMLWTKGIGEFVEAAKLFKKDNPGSNTRFLLVGEPDFENPESIPVATLKQWNHEGIVEWLGHVDVMQEIYSISDVAVLPSYREGLPKSLLEAMSCGLPIITTDAIGCRDLVAEGNGIKVPIKNVQALKRAFEQCEGNKLVCRIMGSKGRELVEKFYSDDTVNSKIINIYKQVLI